MQRARQHDGRGIVDADVDATEALDGCRDSGLNGRLVANVADERQGLAARSLDLLGGRVNRARQLRMRLSRLGRDGDIGAIACRPQRNGQPDTAACARDKERLARQSACHTIPPIVPGPCPTLRWRTAPTCLVHWAPDAAPESLSAHCSRRGGFRGHKACALRC